MNAYIGKHIEFKDAIEQIETGFDPKMRAKIVDVVAKDHGVGEPFYKFVFDFSQYEEYNKQFSKPNFYDDNGDPCLRWHEAGAPLYPSNKLEVVYLEEAYNYFDIVSEEEQITNKVNKIIERVQKAIKDDELREDFCSMNLHVDISKLL